MTPDEAIAQAAISEARRAGKARADLNRRIRQSVGAAAAQAVEAIDKIEAQHGAAVAEWASQLMMEGVLKCLQEHAEAHGREFDWGTRFVVNNP